MYSRTVANPAWGGRLGVIGVVAGLALIVVTLLLGTWQSADLNREVIITGFMIAVFSLVTAFSYSNLRNLVVQIFGGLTILAGAWAVISPFVLGFAYDNLLFPLSIITGLITAPLAGYAVFNLPPERNKPLLNLFSRGWNGWLGVLGFFAGLALIIVVILLGDESVLSVNANVVGVGLMFTGAVGALANNALRHSTMQLIGWATVLIGLWSIVGPFVLRAPIDAPLFGIMVITGVVSAPVAAYAIVTAAKLDREDRIFTTRRRDRNTRDEGRWTWVGRLGVIGVVVGIALIILTLFVGPEDNAAISRNVLITGFMIAFFSIATAFSYGYLRNIVAQIFGGLTLLAGGWAIISPFLFGYPQNSLLFGLSISAGLLTAPLAGYAVFNLPSERNKRFTQLFSRDWDGWLGVLGFFAGLSMIIAVILLDSAPLLTVNASITGVAFMLSGAIGTFGRGYLPTSAKSMIGWLTVVVGFWAVIGPFILQMPQGEPLFAITVITGVVAALVAAYALITQTESGEGGQRFFAAGPRGSGGAPDTRSAPDMRSVSRLRSFGGSMGLRRFSASSSMREFGQASTTLSTWKYWRSWR